ncbi:ABC transporter substrate-binding protein [Jannaschia formosa]|uniref:ABC transporter substrate-binding protein n=1 Tax=Jannaschia formosa TaxID=2259592 RepID=UPI000E1BC6C8|nr:ABC transporter substrate-binding protein [Jannaschia formosa]TFL16368.1 branched-chain amino acid ABC transporter substrate-binding protein [Jannaschia formosa]
MLGGLLAASLATAASARDDNVRLGVLFGFTGPIESLAADFAEAADVAIAEINAAGGILGGREIVAVRADTTCSDTGAAVSAAERLVSGDNVHAILGAGCSGASSAVVSTVLSPRGVLAISPASTSPSLSTIEDRGLFFRTAPSDARQGEVLAELTIERGIGSVAVTYTNNDYGAGLAQSFRDAYEALGGTITLVAAHEDGRGDYSAEVGALATSGAEALMVIGYVDQGGIGIVQASLDTGAFDRFILPDGMLHQTLLDRFGDALDGSIGTTPGGASDALMAYDRLAAEAGATGTGPFRAETYDATALIALAMEAAGSTDSAAMAAALPDLANAPGVPIGPGELARALELVAAGTDIDYQGATAVEMDAAGDAEGSFRRLEIVDGTFAEAGAS